MLKNTFRFFVLLLLLTGWGLAALSLHVIRTADGTMPITLIPKDALSVRDTYVDTRGWTLDDVTNHPAVVGKLIRTNRADVLKNVVSGGDLNAQLAEALTRTPKPAADKSSPATMASQASQTVASWFK